MEFSAASRRRRTAFPGTSGAPAVREKSWSPSLRIASKSVIEFSFGKRSDRSASVPVPTNGLSGSPLAALKDMRLPRCCAPRAGVTCCADGRTLRYNAPRSMSSGHRESHPPLSLHAWVLGSASWQCLLLYPKLRAAARRTLVHTLPRMVLFEMAMRGRTSLT